MSVVMGEFMGSTGLLLCLLVIGFIAYQLGIRRASALVSGRISQLHSLPHYHGYFSALAAIGPAMIVLAIWLSLHESIIMNMVVGNLPETMTNKTDGEIKLLINDIRNLVNGNVIATNLTPEIQQAAKLYSDHRSTSFQLLTFVTFAITLLCGLSGYMSLSKEKRARNAVERFMMFFLIASSTLAIFTTVGIVFSVLYESISFFGKVPFTEFVFGTQWSPQTALRADQVGSSGAFGAIPLFVGTLLISFIALTVAVPIGLLSAVYLSEYATEKTRSIAKPLLEILAGIPTVVYGFFAALTVAPMIRNFGTSIGLDVASESALAAGLVMGVMIIPFVSSLSDDVINAVPQSMRDGALALGATQSETIRKVVFPAALPGIVGGILLAASRAIGETMIVVMAAGLAANLTLNPLDAVTTVTVQIVTLLTGDQEFDSAKTLAAFALGLMLFLTTLVLNVIALHIVRRYREELEV